jgi:hypothetical protein
MMFVLQEWIKPVGCKMQSILLSGFRAPDQKNKSRQEVRPMVEKQVSSKQRKLHADNRDEQRADFVTDTEINLIHNLNLSRLNRARLVNIKYSVLCSRRM